MKIIHFIMFLTDLLVKGSSIYPPRPPPGGSVYFVENHRVGGTKRFGEFLQHHRGPGIGVGHKIHHDPSFRIKFPKSLQSSAEFQGMMSIIIHEENTPLFPQKFGSALATLKQGEGFRDLFEEHLTQV